MRRISIMATDFPQRMTAREMMKTTEEGAFRSLLNMALTRVGRIICGWHGHDSVLQFDRSRVFLECMSCGHQSPGWRLERAPHVRVIPVRRTPGRMAVARRVA
jgi:hypothetical protein